MGWLLGFWSGGEDFDEAGGDYFVFGLFELPDGEAEGVWVARRAAIFGGLVACGRIGIASAHAAGTSTHAANTYGARVGQFLHDFGAGDFEFGRIDLPTVTRGDVA